MMDGKAWIFHDGNDYGHSEGSESITPHALVRVRHCPCSRLEALLKIPGPSSEAQRIRPGRSTTWEDRTTVIL